jgi:hypothetical protein
MPCYQDVSEPMLVVIVGSCGLASNIFGLLLFHGIVAFFTPTSAYLLSVFQSMVTLIHMATLTATRITARYPILMEYPLSLTICPCRIYQFEVVQDLTLPCTDIQPPLELQLHKLRRTWPQLLQLNTDGALRGRRARYVWSSVDR